MWNDEREREIRGKGRERERERERERGGGREREMARKSERNLFLSQHVNSSKNNRNIKL